MGVLNTNKTKLSKMMMNPATFHFMRHVAEYNLTYATTAEYEARLNLFTQRH